MNPPIPQQGQPQQQQYTPEQIDQMLRRMRVNEQHVNGLFGENLSVQQRQQTLQQIIDGAVTEALTRAQLLHQGEFGKFRSEYDQQQALVQELYREHSMNRFLGDYPELKDYRQFVDDSIAEVSGLPEQPKDIKEFFQRVAASAEGRVKALKQDFALAPRGQAPQGQAPQGPGQPQPGGPTVTPPAYTGPSTPPSGGAGAPAKKSSVSDIWGDPEA
jgi:hypothetical protein